MNFACTQWTRAPRQVPEGRTLFAIGDVHGHADELIALRALIRNEIDANPGVSSVVVYLGDYIDRGPDSKRVLETLSAGIGGAAEEVFLVGNHDQFLIELLNLDPDLDLRFMDTWYQNGGSATMLSLQVDGYGRLLQDGDLAQLSARAHAALGADLVGFLMRLATVHRAGEYVFVHAGIDPAQDLDNQSFVDLLMMREPFLSARHGWKHSFCVVHGHSISMPSVLRHRIGVDAGCYQHGALCAVQLKGDRLRFLGATRIPDYPWNERLGGKTGEWRWSAA